MYACLGRWKYHAVEVSDSVNLGDFVDAKGRLVEEVLTPMEQFVEGLTCLCTDTPSSSKAGLEKDN